jgi:hypothetical protein
MAQAEYLENSNILRSLEEVPIGQFGLALAAAYPHQIDPELGELALRRQTAWQKWVEVGHTLGPQQPEYNVARKQLGECQTAYRNKIDGIMTGLHRRVEQDKTLLDLYRAEEDRVKKEMADQRRN